jgi:hypothetical protein
MNAAIRKRTPAAFQLFPPRKVFIQRSFPSPALPDISTQPSCHLRQGMGIQEHRVASAVRTVTASLRDRLRLREIRERFAECETANHDDCSAGEKKRATAETMQAVTPDLVRHVVCSS